MDLEKAFVLDGLYLLAILILLMLCFSVLACAFSNTVLATFLLPSLLIGTS